MSTYADIPKDFKGLAKRIEDSDIPRIGATIGVGEDEVHAVMDVESRGTGFDGQGRPLILFEPHKFWKNLPVNRREEARSLELAYPVWGTRPYPRDSYPILKRAIEMHPEAALKSASWGLGQIMGENYKLAGYDSVVDMVVAFCEDEENHLQAMMNFIRNAKLDVYLRTHQWAKFAEGYNGKLYRANQYDTRLERAFNRWDNIRNTPYDPKAAITPKDTSPITPPEVVLPSTTPKSSAPSVTLPTPASTATPTTPVSTAPATSWWTKIKSVFRR